MLAPLLLATALVIRPEHLPVRQVAPPIVVDRETLQKFGDGSLNLFAYCDASRQTWIMVTNAGPTPFVVEWTLTATKPGYPPDRWSNVSSVEPGQFEGWMSSAPFLHLEIRYDDDGLPITKSIDASCSATSDLASGLEDWSAR